MLILEKAWAKMFGSFQSIIWGVPGECLTNLTGACALTQGLTQRSHPPAVVKAVGRRITES